MPQKKLPQSKHFDLHQLADGIYAAVHKDGGAAYSNAGVIDLGDKTLVVDSFDTLAAGRDLRLAAETLTGRPVDTLILTHPHSDHWGGAQVFNPNTSFLTTPEILRVAKEWGEGMVEDAQNPQEWEEWVQEMEDQLKTEQDQGVRMGLERSIARARQTISEFSEFQPRYADKTFEGQVTFQGSARRAELRSMGRGHSEEDIVLLLPEDNIAFIGDIGFFNTQPFMGYCEVGHWRTQMQFFLDSGFEFFVPGHGTLGSKEEISLQLKYTEVLEELVGEVVNNGGSFEEAMEISFPEPFAAWLVGGMGRFEVNVRYMFKYKGGELPE